MITTGTNSNTLQDYPGYVRRLDRDQYVQVLSAALRIPEYRFARESVLSWLAYYPGDLQVSLYYAKALLGEGRTQQAIPILEGLCQADPEFEEAVELLAACETNPGSDYGKKSLESSTGLFASWCYALKGHQPVPEVKPTAKGIRIEPWAEILWMARQASSEGDSDSAELLIQQAIGADPPTPLIATLHLQQLYTQVVSKQIPLASQRSLAEYYHQRWPDCIACTLYLADRLISGGESDRGVELLHYAATRDIGGQVAERIWGPDHPYRSIWPGQLSLPLSTQVPASVAALLGWNRLSSRGEPEGRIPQPKSIDLDESQSISQPQHLRDVPKPGALTPVFLAKQAGEPKRVSNFQIKKLPDDLRPIQSELERVAKHVNRPGETRLDRRFPVYVLLSSRAGLEKQYGQERTLNLIVEMGKLTQIIQKNHPFDQNQKWGARLFLADDPEYTCPLGIRPARPEDPWELKLSLIDLDAALKKRGEMIGSLLIVGGPEVVPFHNLPNPVDDSDTEVPSDNPYGTRDENYFIPEWPVGRIPGGKGDNIDALLIFIHQLQKAYGPASKKQFWALRWLQMIGNKLRIFRRSVDRSIGYTAAIWRQAASSVYRSIGDPRAIFVSPPQGLNNGSGQGQYTGVPVLAGELGYFNLHGLIDSSDWYGQNDPLESGGLPDYPIALRPEDIYKTRQKSSKRNGTVNSRNPVHGVPQLIFSEACYGGYINDKSIEEAISLTFLATGSHAFVGSTCMAYGSIHESPLIGADLIGHTFWNLVQGGFPAGEALRRAKIHLAREMHRRQGYLDGEDQKTIISFVLYGDPMLRTSTNQREVKSAARLIKPPKPVRTVCDRGCEPKDTQHLAEDVYENVKQIVKDYLPGMGDASIAYALEHIQCQAKGHTCPTSQFQVKSSKFIEPERKLIILSKQINGGRHTHTQVARLRLNGEGKLVKLAISR